MGELIFGNDIIKQNRLQNMGLIYRLPLETPHLIIYILYVKFTDKWHHPRNAACRQQSTLVGCKAQSVWHGGYQAGPNFPRELEGAKHIRTNMIFSASAICFDNHNHMSSALVAHPHHHSVHGWSAMQIAQAGMIIHFPTPHDAPMCSTHIATSGFNLGNDQ